MGFLIAVVMMCSFAQAQDEEPHFGGVKTIDLSTDGTQAPNHAIVKFGPLGHAVLYQFSTRVRMDFEGKLAKGDYVVAVSPKCTKTYGKAWTELTHIKSDGNEISTEETLPHASLHESKPGAVVLQDKVLALFRNKQGKLTYVDCRPIAAGP